MATPLPEHDRTAWLEREVERLQRLTKRLAQVGASSAESLLTLEDRGDRLTAVNSSLAAANARSSELVAEIIVKNEQIRELNVALSASNARAAEVVAQLEEALLQIKTLTGIIPICMHCHKIRDAQSDWGKLEKYIEEHSDAHFSHGICPACLDEHHSGA